jgi:NAD(P)-dependent dehydrogenase (short-subunit alcohol dehydrogenase family)
MVAFREKVVFVTGGASGIGLAIGEAFAKEGARVVLADINGARLEEAARAISGKVMPILLDVTQRDAWARARSHVEVDFGPVDILCNNAGIASDGNTLTEMDPDAFDRMIRITLTSVFNGIACFTSSMIARKSGHIVNTASMAGLIHYPAIGAYAAAKAGVIALSDSLRAEMEPFGVGVTALCPSTVATRIDETTLAAGSERKRPIGREKKSPSMIDPAEVAQAVVDGVRNNYAYVITHGEHRRTFDKRLEKILAAFDRAPVH